MVQTHYFTQSHSHITLGTRLGSGGEGDVFLVEGDPKVVAKIYHTPPDAHKVAKLQYMASHHDADLTQIAAWVAQLLFADAECTSVVGFLMPKVEHAKPIHELYNTKSRKLHFPKADWKFLVHTAVNVANAFAVVHAHGHTIGDVNHSSIFVKHDATVVLIDCDSFEINTEADTFPSLVGVPEFTPPELQGIPFDQIDRTPNHDCFGLAILIFHLLFLGRHPFAGVYLDKGEMPTVKAIAEKRFAYGKGATARKMQPPPFTLLFEVLPNDMETLFNRAFIEAQRPKAEEWIQALKSCLASVKTCKVNESHQFPPEATQCPWCRIANQTHLDLFAPIFIDIGVLFENLHIRPTLKWQTEFHPSESIVALREKLEQQSRNTQIGLSIPPALAAIYFTLLELGPAGIPLLMIVTAYITFFRKHESVTNKRQELVLKSVAKSLERNAEAQQVWQQYNECYWKWIKRHGKIKNEMDSLINTYHTELDTLKADWDYFKTRPSRHNEVKLKMRLEVLKHKKPEIQRAINKYEKRLKSALKLYLDFMQAKADYEYLYKDTW